MKLYCCISLETLNISIYLTHYFTIFLHAYTSLYHHREERVVRRPQPEPTTTRAMISHIASNDLAYCHIRSCTCKSFTDARAATPLWDRFPHSCVCVCVCVRVPMRARARAMISQSAMFDLVHVRVHRRPRSNTSMGQISTRTCVCVCVSMRACAHPGTCIAYTTK